jgi:hypothetical protein
MLLFAFTGLITTVFWKKTEVPKVVRVALAVYFCTILCQGIIWPILSWQDLDVNWDNFYVLTQSFFTIVEFLTFSIIFYNILVSKKMKTILQYLGLIFPLLCLAYFMSSKSLGGQPYHASVVASFLMIAAALFYFYELFLYPPTKRLTKEPAFWIATGILTYLVCLIPTLLVLQFVSTLDFYKYESLAMLNFVASSGLYCFFIKALLCKTYQTTSS